MTKMKKNCRRWIFMFLAIVMTFGMLPLSAAASWTPQQSVSFEQSITPASGSLIGRSVQFGYSDDAHWGGARVTMGGSTIFPFRYVATLDGVVYEAFCADPRIAGPEHPDGPAYTVYASRPQLINILRYGFPNNRRMWDQSYSYSHPETYAAYITRVTVAYATHGGTLAGNPDIINDAHNFVAGTSTWQESQHFVPDRQIRINGVENAISDGTSEGGMIVSDVFNLSNNHSNNPVMFRWQAGTPAGTEIRNSANGAVMATAPGLPSNNSFDGALSFRLAVPEGANVEAAGVEIVGIHDAYAGQVWAARAPNIGSRQFQDMVFYIPRMIATASMGEIPEVPGPGRFRILKTNTSGTALSGAVFEITGSDPSMPMTVTVPASGWTSPELVPGTYTVTEITPPAGHQLGSNPTQTVTITEGQTETVTITFENEPYTNGNGTTPEPPRRVPPPPVRIQKICALGRYNIPGALVRIEGRSSHQIVTGDGQIWEIDNTGFDVSVVLSAGATLPVEQPATEENPYPVRFEVEDGVLTIYNIPWGYFRVQEERAPDGYSLLPQHTAYSFWVLPPNVLIDAEIDESTGDATFIIDEDENVNAILITLENYPFGEIVVYKRAINNGIEGEFLEGAMFRIEGFFVEGNAPQIIDMAGTTDANGRLVFRGLPAGNYTITELQAPAGFMRNYPYHRSVNVSWGQLDGHPTRPAPSVVFFNTPKSSLEVLKIDGDTGAVLEGAIFELTDPTTGETWQATTGSDGIAVFGGGINGNWLYPDRTYILTEIQPPPGYVLIAIPQEIVLSPGDNNRITIRNYINPSLTIIKRDRDTQEPLAGAVFEVSFENGQTVQGSPFTTGSDGTVTIPWTLFEGNIERTLIVTEIVPPPGYHLADPNWQRVTMRQGENNIVTFENTRMPTITIQKRDAVTGDPIANAEFTIERIGYGMLTGNPFRTNANGQIVMPFQYAGMYRIIETRAAQNYWLDPLEQNRSWTIQVRENEDYLLNVENTLLPTLVITKWNALTNRPVPLTHFRVEFEVPNSPNVRLIGNFVTDANGQIIIPFVGVGWYRITETRAAPGMALNVNNNYRVFLNPGDNTYQFLSQIMGTDSPLYIESESDDDYEMSYIVRDEYPEYLEYPYDDLPYTHEDFESMTDAEIVQFVAGNIQVTGGDSHLVGEGIWNWPRAIRFPTNTIL